MILCCDLDLQGLSVEAADSATIDTCKFMSDPVTPIEQLEMVTIITSSAPTHLSLRPDGMTE